MIKTDSDPLRFVHAARAAVQSLDPDQPVGGIAAMDQRLDDSLSGERFRLFLFSAFAVLALVLAAVGVYGVMCYSVRLRMHEIGIRMALGASVPDVLTIILRHALKLAMIGVLSGVALALGATRLMSTLLFGVKPNDSLLSEHQWCRSWSSPRPASCHHFAPPAPTHSEFSERNSPQTTVAAPPTAVSIR